jgi:O-acetyl-ADP-ribose deacetylase
VSDFALRLSVGSKVLDFRGPADITRESTDAIVNAANSTLLGGGGVDGAIHHAGGPAILAACRTIVDQIGRLPPGQAVITPGGNLRARYVIHTVGPVFRGGEQGEAQMLASCYRESMKLAHSYSLNSVAFPSISTGAFGYPLNLAADVAIKSLTEALSQATTVNEVRFVLFDHGTLRAYVSAAESFCRSGPSSSYTIEKGSQ